MSAKEMFEKLGYKQSKPENVPVLFYVREVNSCEEIIFDLKYKKIYKEIDGELTEITLDELKAINQQIEELGWYER